MIWVVVKETCSNCEGNGEYWVGDTLVDCDKCHGTGCREYEMPIDELRDLLQGGPR